MEGPCFRKCTLVKQCEKSGLDGLGQEKDTDPNTTVARLKDIERAG